MKLLRRDLLLPIGSAGLMGGLPVFFYLTDFFQIEKTQLLTTGFIAIWIVIGGVGVIGKQTAIIPQRMVLLCSLGFFYFYFFNWMMWPKGSQLDELMWAYASAHAVIPFLFGSFFDQRDLRIFLKGVAFWGTLLGVIVIINYIFTLSTEPGFKTSRFTVAFALNPISQSRNIGYAILLLYAQALIKPGKFHIPIILMLMLALLLGGSRSPAIALIMAMLAVTYFATGVIRKNMIFLVIVGVTIGITMILPEGVWNRYFSMDMWLEEETGTGVPVRFEAVMFAIERWLEYPFFGSGTSGNKTIYYAHTIFPQILMEMGIIGVGLYLGMLVPPLFSFVNRIRKRTEVHWEINAFAGLLIYGLMVTQLTGNHMTLNSIWLPMGILTAWRRFFPEGNEEISREENYLADTKPRFAS